MKYTQNHLLNALRFAAYSADPNPTGAVEWKREGLQNPHNVDFDFFDRGDEYRPTGNARFDEIVRAANPTFHYGFVAAYSREGKGDAEGNFVPGTEFDYIAFPPLSAFNGEGEERERNYLRTLAHELVHWTQGTGRTGREPAGMNPMERFMAGITGEPPESYVLEELTAEMGAALLMDSIGVDPDLPARARYVSNWMHAARPESRERLLDKAEAQAKRAVNWLLEKAHVDVQEAA